jgi:hypothetical protein
VSRQDARQLGTGFVRNMHQQKVHERKHAALIDLFRSLLHQLMTAQIRVKDLDLDEILPQPVAEIGDGGAPSGGVLVKEWQVVHN